MIFSSADSLLRRHKVDLYLSGHDHDLQHIEFKGHPTSFVISGGGGAELVGWTTSPRERGPWVFGRSGLPTCRSRRRNWWCGTLAKTQLCSMSSRSRWT